MKNSMMILVVVSVVSAVFVVVMVIVATGVTTNAADALAPRLDALDAKVAAIDALAPRLGALEEFKTKVEAQLAANNRNIAALLTVITTDPAFLEEVKDDKGKVTRKQRYTINQPAPVAPDTETQKEVE